jgi:hypothetical protein
MQVGQNNPLNQTLEKMDLALKQGTEKKYK